MHLKFFFRNFWEVFHGEEFLNLSQEKLIEFIKCDELEVDKEESVFKAVMKWFAHDPECRKTDFHKVFLNSLHS